MPGLSYDNASGNKFLFNGKELQTELDMYDFGARFYDPSLGRWYSVDPLAEKYYDFSPYVGLGNNPVRYVDPDGRVLDDYVFNEEGKYVRTDKNDKPDKLVIENSKTHKQTSYEFNDPPTDVGAINYNIQKFGEAFKDIKFIYTIDDKTIDAMMKESGVEYMDSDTKRRWFTVYHSLPGGKLDFSAFHLPIELAKAGEHETWDIENELFKDKGPIFLFSNTSRAYNYMDAGNWLWGNSIARIGGSHANATSWSKKFNPWDTYADQYAIQQGYFYGAGFREPKK